MGNGQEPTPKPEKRSFFVVYFFKSGLVVGACDRAPTTYQKHTVILVVVCTVVLLAAGRVNPLRSPVHLSFERLCALN